MDGVGIITNQFDNWEMITEGILISQGKVISNSYFGVDGLNRTKVLQEFSVSNPTGNQTQFSINSKLISDSFQIIGYIGNNVSFNGFYSKSELPINSNWVSVLIAVCVFIISRIDYKKSTTTNEAGKVIETKEETSWNGFPSGGGSGLTNYTTFKNQNFMAEHIVVVSNFDFNNNPLEPILVSNIELVQVQGFLLPSFNIINYNLSN